MVGLAQLETFPERGARNPWLHPVRARGPQLLRPLASSGLLLVIHAMPYEVSGRALVGEWVTVFVSGVTLGSRYPIPAAGQPQGFERHWLPVGLHIPIAIALAVYLLSVGVVDHFQGRVTGVTALASLQKQGQVSLSILWAALGGGAFVAGVIHWTGTLRVAGLVLLALATTKVFLYDLASLDATYNVPSFIGLGVLLLASSYAYQRFKPEIGLGSEPSSNR